MRLGDGHGIQNPLGMPLSEFEQAQGCPIGLADTLFPFLYRLWTNIQRGSKHGLREIEPVSQRRNMSGSERRRCLHGDLIHRQDGFARTHRFLLGFLVRHEGYNRGTEYHA